MTITCQSTKELVNVIAELVKHGLTFKADHDTLVITLTGGY
jgi:hypothetical protein